MKVKTWIPLVLAVVLGLAALKFTRDAMSRGGSGKADDSKFVATVTAAHDIAPGQQLTAADLTTAKVEAAAIPTGSFKSPADAIDRVTNTGLVKGQTVLESLLAPKGTAAGVQALIPAGMRAMTLHVDEWTGLGGLLMPGCRVDIIAVVRSADQKDQTSRTIVQNVEVRAIGRLITGTTPAVDPNLPAGAPTPAPTSVTLLVTPEQAEAIQLASVGGKPWLALRNTNDVKSFHSEGTSVADLRGDTFHTETFPTNVTVETSIKPSPDPFADKPSTGGVSRAPRTRTVLFIRNGKEQTMEVEAAPQPPADWLGAETDTRGAADGK
jgi:pilus assembly protein CpaB